MGSSPGCILASLGPNIPLHHHRCPPALHRVQTSKDLISFLKKWKLNAFGDFWEEMEQLGDWEGYRGSLAKAGVEVRSSSDYIADI